MASKEIVVEFKNIRKKYGNFLANDNISFQLHKGEILSLLGENGAGKTTLMKLLAGMSQPTTGEIFIHGKKVTMKSANEALRLGIAMIHQHFMLIEEFTVLENIILGLEPTNKGHLDIVKARKDIEKIEHKYHLKVDLDAKVRNISVGMRQRVEIIKGLYKKADILIFDEPTAALTPNEIEGLLKVFRKLQSENKSIIFITHKIAEIKKIADTIVIIRSGKIIKNTKPSLDSVEKLAELMVGRKISTSVNRDTRNNSNKVLTISNLVVEKNKRKIVNNISFEVGEKEIVGIAGVEGNGQKEVIDVIMGMQKAKNGYIYLNQSSITNLSTHDIIERKVSYIPEDRQREGLVLGFSISENLILKTYANKQNSKYGWINYNQVYESGKKAVKAFGIKSQSEKSKVNELSGGNQQKVIIARELLSDPELLIAVNPTRGVDIGAIEYIHQRIIEQRNQGSAVLLVSFELDEIMKLADRILVFKDGQITGQVTPKDTSSEELGLLMSGGENL